MRYAQIKNGHKLHLVYEPGEGKDPRNLTPSGSLSFPLCGTKAERYVMTINVPLGRACHNCLRVYQARHG